MNWKTYSSDLTCLPAYATKRNPERETYGSVLAEIAETLGTPLMPWQRYVADVALEINPVNGRLQYRTVVVTVPRQSGKTTLTLSAMVHRAIGFGARQTILYTAQTQKAARLKWEEDHVRALENSPFKNMFSVRYGMGTEQIKWKNGSRHALTAPTEKAGHGEVVDMAVIDEAFAQDDNRLEQALRPAMITRPEPQLWIISTAGTAKSTYLRHKVNTGRMKCEQEPLGNTFAYFEWSAPLEADPGDPNTWWSCMPALGHTVQEEAIRANYQDMELQEFRRAFLNQWIDDVPNQWMVIGANDWENVCDKASQIAPDSPMAFALDVTPDRTFGCIAVAGKRSDGKLHVEITRNSEGILDHRPGINWMVPRMKDLFEKWDPCAVVIQPNSPAGTLIPELEAAGIPVLKPSAAEYAGACGRIYDAVYASPSEIRHLGQASLSVALAGAVKMELGEGAWKWNRKMVAVDISPLVAITLAVWGLTVNGNKSTPVPWVDGL